MSNAPIPTSPTTPASAIDPSYQPFHDIRPPSASKRPDIPMETPHVTPANISAEDTLHTSQNPLTTTSSSSSSSNPHHHTSKPTADDDNNNNDDDDDDDSSSSPNLTPHDFLTTHPPTLPTPPFIHIHGIPNFRDMGGYSCPPPSGADPMKKYMVRQNMLFRCAHPTQLTALGARTLRDRLGVTDIFDLRSMQEIEKLKKGGGGGGVVGASVEKVKLDGEEEEEEEEVLDTSQGYVVIPGVQRTFTPVYKMEDYGPVTLARKLKWYTAANGEGKDYSEGFVNAYRDIAMAAAGNEGAYAVILRQLLKSGEERKGRGRPMSMLANLDGIEAHMKMMMMMDGEGGGGGGGEEGENKKEKKKKRNGGVVFHCTAGKDRTGVLGAVVLKLCGVDDETICWEYAITEPGLGDWRTVFIERISRDGLGGGVSRAEAARICGSRAANIRQWLKVVLDGEFGGVEKYLTERVGLSASEVARLKDGLVVEAKYEADIVRPVSIDGWTLDGGMEDEFSLHERLQSGRGTGEENGSVEVDDGDRP